MTLAEEDGGGTGLSKIFLKYLGFKIFQKIFSCKRKMCSKDLLGSFRRVGVLVIAEEWTKMKQKGNPVFISFYELALELVLAVVIIINLSMLSLFYV